MFIPPPPTEDDDNHDNKFETGQTCAKNPHWISYEEFCVGVEKFGGWFVKKS